MKNKVFIDGQHGTTGLKINERLSTRKDIELIDISEENRKDPKVKEKRLNEADIVFLCLPDNAARESVSLIKNKAVCVIDGSTAHRVTEGWVYGLPELKKEQRSLIRNSKRIAVPGCHATGFIAMLYPLAAFGIVGADYPVTCNTIAGYSGGGKTMIADYQGENVPDYIKNPRPYALGLNHKHVPEMTSRKMPSGMNGMSGMVGKMSGKSMSQSMPGGMNGMSGMVGKMTGRSMSQGMSGGMMSKMSVPRTTTKYEMRKLSTERPLIRNPNNKRVNMAKMSKSEKWNLPKTKKRKFVMG